jgi:hypothetical protein
MKGRRVKDGDRAQILNTFARGLSGVLRQG